MRLQGKHGGILAHSPESEIGVLGYTICLAMRRTIAISLLMMFSWMLIAPLFGPDADANLPPCCRRNGKHHCMMRMMGRLSGNRKNFSSATEKCPYFPANTYAIHSATNKPEHGEQFYAEAGRSTACFPQTEALFRISFPRSHQRRGPPALLA